MSTSSNVRRLLLCASTALVHVPYSASAQDDENETFTLDPIIVRTNREESTVLDVPANISIIDGEEIKDRNITDFGDLTRTIPGVTAGRQTTATDPFSTFGGINIRGVGGNRVQLQVDGSRIPERIIDGTRDYVDFSFIKQVEIFRGPSSVLWGSDALGGVVAFETIDPEDILDGRDRGLNARLAYSSFDKGTTASLSYAQRLSPTLEVLLGLSHYAGSEPELSNARADGGIYGCPRNLNWGATPCNAFDPTDSSSDKLLAKMVWTPDSRHRFEFTADILSRETNVQQNYLLGPQYSSFTGLPTGEIVHNKNRSLDLKRERYAIEHIWTPDNGFVENVRTVLSYTPNGYERTGTELSQSVVGDSMSTRDYLSYSEDFLELDVQAYSVFIAGQTEHNLIYGFDGDLTKSDYSRLDVETNLTTGAVTSKPAGGFNFANSDTRRADIFIQDRIVFGNGRFELTPGLRYATYKITPRTNADYRPVIGLEPRVREDKKLLKSLGALYRFNDTYSVWAKYGEGFKMPTAQQLFTSVPGSFFDLIPAPNLEPEEVESYEIGLRGEYGNGFFAINGFNAKYDNFIQSFYNIPGTAQYTYRNLSSVDVWGVEASAAWAFSDLLSGSISASWQKGTQMVSADADETPHTLPPLTAVISLRQDLPQYDLSLEAVGTFASAVSETENPDDFKPAGYGLLDLYASWQIIPNGALNFGVQNVFDKRYFTANAATYSQSATAAVARSNPIELQTGLGRTFTVSFDMAF
ncbi:TonB-dependent hemoglobin/transferrin/lactoferrin family receptor [Pukyongiella litopenaei]|uniref:TonB-dependent hemoglobin/transferrin/lactoferrin family receptor n=1 Tax=Pukyongiella litopenaei TaxID=2605946 RepID=A0A2S0MPY1_9RHOB|nr:TonB-dependent hemoglobin/transferrin/lactoferrin family receptor [Pukyongiella litopenaei]AVO37949.1 TonB-dependent hemoglobin/transferrin/lactoferrin family receptor [Pukyongiella litopenaei]